MCATGKCVDSALRCKTILNVELLTRVKEESSPSFTYLNLECQSLHPADGNPVAAGQEEEELLLVLQAEVVMEDGPEVDNGRVVGGIALFVLRRPLELLPVVVLVPHDHRHQLLGLEEVHH